MGDSSSDAHEYLQRLELEKTLKELAMALIHHQPEKPRDFLIEALSAMLNGTRNEGVFDEEEVRAVYRSLQTRVSDSIPVRSARLGLKMLMLNKFNAADAVSVEFPDFVTEPEFMSAALCALNNSS